MLKLKNNYCSPLNENNFSENKSCYSYDDLKKIAEQYNVLNKEKKIRISKNRDRLYKNIQNAMINTCKNEFCWGKNYLSKEKINTIFRPEKPLSWYNNKREWLSTTDINNCMKQYEHLHKDFMYIGTFPMDFQNKDLYGRCIGKILCDFNIKNLKKEKKTKFAFVLNLDYNHQSGSHWVSVFCNLNKKNTNYGIYYYDSTSYKPTKEVNEFFSLVKSQVNDINFKSSYNKIQKQFKNSECGIYAMIFLIQCLKNIPFKKICKYMPKDDDVNKLRDILYTPSLKLK